MTASSLVILAGRLVGTQAVETARNVAVRPSLCPLVANDTSATSFGLTQ